MPPSPTSKYHLIPISRAQSRVVLPSAAEAVSLAGWKWSWTTARRSGSQTLVAPICSRMILEAGGMVRSWPIAKSTRARIRSPGLTDSLPLARARIFSVMFIGIPLNPLQVLDHGVAGLGGGQVAADVAGALAGAGGGGHPRLRRARLRPAGEGGRHPFPTQCRVDR